MDRRTLLKLLGGVAALPALGKAIKGTGIKSIKAVGKVLPKVQGMPEWFTPLVNKIMKEGVDVSPAVKRVEDMTTVKKLEIPSATGEPEVITLTQNKVTGEISIESNYGGVGDAPLEINYRPPKTDIDVTTGKVIKEPGDFSVVEQRPRPVGGPEDADFDFEFENLNIDDAFSDVERLEKIATGKIKDTKKIAERAKGRQMLEESPYEDIINRYPDPEAEYDKMKDAGFFDDDYADGGLASFANGGKAKKKSKAEEPLSKYKSYSEQELLENIEAKRPNQLQSFSLEDYQLNTMPMFEPRDVAPPKSYSPMPNIYDTPRLSQVNLADGGVASMFRERPGYAEGGSLPNFVTAPSGIEWELFYSPFSGKPLYRPKFDASRNDLVYYGIDPEQFFKDIMATGTSTPTTTEIPTVDPFSGQQVTIQDLIDANKEMSAKAPPGQSFTEEGLRKNAEDDAARLQSMMEAFNSGFYNKVPTTDPFSGQQVSAQDQLAFTQPQVEIFPQQNIFQPPSPVDQFIGERRFQSEADAAARSGIPFTKKIQDYLGSFYSGPEIANMQEQTFGTSNLPGATGVVSDLRHATAASQIRDKIANAVSMGYFNPAGLLPQSLGLFGSQVLGAANEIQSIRPNMQSLRDIGEDLVANFYGATQVPYGQSASATYNQLLNNPSLPSAQMRSQQEAAARVTPKMANGGRVSMFEGGLTKTVPPAKGPDSQGVESLFRRRYN